MKSPANATYFISQKPMDVKCNAALLKRENRAFNSFLLMTSALHGICTQLNIGVNMRIMKAPMALRYLLGDPMKALKLYRNNPRYDMPGLLRGGFEHAPLSAIFPCDSRSRYLSSLAYAYSLYGFL